MNTVMARSHRKQRSVRLLLLRLAGAGLLFATGAIHLDLYLTGYRTIPTIGWLFLLQVITAFVLGLMVLVGSRLAAAAGAGFLLSTLGGYLLSIWFGLFGFREVRTTAGIWAGVIEVLGFAALAAFALAPLPQHAVRGPRMARVRDGLPGALAAVGALSVLAFVLLGVAVAGANTAPTASSSGGGGGASGSGQALKTMSVKGVTVLTNAKGLTLYSFAPDTPTKSACYSSCAAYWPPVAGSVKLAPGVPGTLTTIKRTDGTTQAVYNGHPLYTYIADTAPGQANGNNINLNGGLWREIVAASG
jgi:predicted lipoprotein with Yx(FWY)xxD motif